MLLTGMCLRRRKACEHFLMCVCLGHPGGLQKLDWGMEWELFTPLL